VLQITVGGFVAYYATVNHWGAEPGGFNPLVVAVCIFVAAAGMMAVIDLARRFCAFVAWSYRHAKRLLVLGADRRQQRGRRRQVGRGHQSLIP